MKLPITEKWDGQNYYVDADGKPIGIHDVVLQLNHFWESSEAALSVIPLDKPITVEEIDRMIHVVSKYGHALKTSQIIAWLEAIRTTFAQHLLYTAALEKDKS